MRVFIGFLVVIISLGFTLQSCGEYRKKEIRTNKEPSLLVQELCGQCHGLKVGDKVIAEGKPQITLLQGKTEEEWRKTVTKMIEQHNCPVPGGVNGPTYNKIVKYLAENYGPTIATQLLPTDDTELVKIACGTCHGIVIIDANNPTNIIMRVTKSPLGGDIKIPAGKQDWSETVKRMIEKNGCAIPGGTQGQIFTRIVNWLNTNVGPNVGQHLDPNTATGQQLTQVYCGACHGIIINGQRITTGNKFWDIELPLNKDAKGWRETVEKMIYKNNCPVPGGINGQAVDKIVNYLTNLAIPQPDLTTKTGQELTQMFCGICHGLVVANQRITLNAIGVDVTLLDGKQPGTRNDWAFTVARMIEKNGCPVPGGVNDCSVDPTTPYCKIVSYLENNFGPGCCGDVSTWSDEKIVKAVCGSCHGIRGYEKILTVSPGLDMWLFDGKGQQDWEITVGRMINVNGAIVPGGQGGTIFNRIVNWLVSNAPPGCCGYIPVSEPELIAQAACGTCHGIVIGSATNNKRLTRGMSLYLGIVYGWDAMPLGKDIVHWTKTVNRMVQRRIATGGSIPDAQQREAMINWFVQEANPSVYSDPGTQGLRDGRELYMTYCHKCHGPTAGGSYMDLGKQWVTNLGVGDPPANSPTTVGPPTLRGQPSGMMHWWPPSGDFSIMPYYLWNNYSYGFPDRKVHNNEWSLVANFLSSFGGTWGGMMGPANYGLDTDYLPPEGDGDGDGTIEYGWDSTPPSAPTGVQAVGSTGTISVTWNANNNERDFMGYLVFYAPVSSCNTDCSSCSWWTRANTVVSTLDNVEYQMPVYGGSYTITGLNPGNYCVAVASVDFACWSPRPANMAVPCNFAETTVGPVQVQ